VITAIGRRTRRLLDGAREASPVAASGIPPDAASGTLVRRLVLVLGVAILVAVAPYLPGLIGGAILFVCAAPGHRRLARVIGARGSAAVAIIAVLALLLLPAAWIVSTALSQASEAARWVQTSDLLARLARARDGSLEVGEHLAAAGGALVSWLSGRTLALFGSATRATLNLIVALFGLYYLLLAADGAWDRTTRIIPLHPAIIERLRARFVAVTEALVLGTLLTAVVQGALVGTGFALVGLPAPVLWGVVTAIVSMLPVMGASFVWLPGTAVLLAQHRIGAAVTLAVIGGLITSNADNLIRLSVFRRVSGIHPMLTLVGGFAGVGAFGFAGILIGPVLLSYFFELLALAGAWRDEGAAPRVLPAPDQTLLASVARPGDAGG
jgi:predicted PurR-regulated permease PerM